MPAWWNWPSLAVPPLQPQPQEGLPVSSVPHLFPPQQKPAEPLHPGSLRSCLSCDPSLSSMSHTTLPARNPRLTWPPSAAQSGIPRDLEDVQPQPCCLPAASHRLCSLSCSLTSLKWFILHAAAEEESDRDIEGEGGGENETHTHINTCRSEVKDLIKFSWGIRSPSHGAWLPILMLQSEISPSQRPTLTQICWKNISNAVLV